MLDTPFMQGVAGLLCIHASGIEIIVHGWY